MPENNDLRELHAAFAEFKATNDALLAEVKTYGTANGELQAKLNKLHEVMDQKEAAINARFAEVEKAAAWKAQIDERLEALDAKLSRKGGFEKPGEAETEQRLLARKAFFKALRSGTPDVKMLRGAEGWTDAEFKSLIVGNDKTGGYLAPTEYVNEMLTSVVEFSNLRSIVRVRTTSSGSVTMPKRTQSAAATWVAEKGTRTETQNPNWGLEEVKVHEMHALAKVSHADLEDSLFDLEGFLRDEFAEQFGVSEGLALVSGNSVGKPEGVLTNADITSVISGSNSTITADQLIALYYELKEAYLNNATWVMSRSTLKVIRQLKAANNNEYVWTPGIKSDARPATILDRPYITAPDMPDCVTQNNYPILFGDFRRGYLVVDRIALEVMIDPYTSKGTGMVEFSARRRVGGQVMIAEAIKKMKVSAS